MGDKDLRWISARRVKLLRNKERKLGLVTPFAERRKPFRTSTLFGEFTRMKTGARLGWVGCMLWMLNIATSAKPAWIGWLIGLTAIALLMVGTVIAGAQKGRTSLGVGLSLFAFVFGIGFLIMMLVPEKKAQHIAESSATPNGGPPAQPSDSGVTEGRSSVG